MTNKVRAAIVAAFTVLAVVAGVFLWNNDTANAATGPRSGLSWISGAYVEHSASKIVPYENGRGKKLDAVVVFPARESQSAMLNNWWLAGVTPVTNDGGWAVVTVPMWAQDQNVNTDTTALFRALGEQIQQTLPANRTIVRVGWEMNLPGQYWNVTTGNRTAWVARFKNAVNQLRQYAPGVKIAFNPNEGPSQTNLSDIGGLATELKDYYDYVGPDYYNWYSQVDNQTQWNQRYAASYGMKYWEDFARANGKGFTVPEWGGAPAVNNSTGVFYTQKLVERFAALAAEGIPVMEAHFNEPAEYIRNSLWNPEQMPAMAAALRDALAAQTNPPTTQPTTPPTTQPTTPVPTPTTLRVEAETFTLVNSMGGAFDDPATSGGKYMLIWWTDRIEKTINTPATQTIVVRAKGDNSARMELWVDNVKVGNTISVASAYTNYTFNKPLTAGSHKIEVRHPNSSTNPDQNLMVDWVDFQGATVPPTTTPPTTQPTTTPPTC